MQKKSKILIVIEEGPHFHYYKTVMKMLCSRGHSVKVLFAKREDRIWKEFESELLRKFPNLSWGKSFYRSGFWKFLLLNTRPILNYRRYLLSKNISNFYIERSKTCQPIWLRPLIMFQFLNINFLIRFGFTEKLLKWIERKTPIDARIIKQLKEINPDVMLIASGNNLATTSPDYDYVKAAKKLDIPHAFSILSWDYLQTKGVIHAEPDLLLVWNYIHRDVAVNSLGFPEKNIKMVGATQFDEWFTYLNTQPSQGKNEFCSKYGFRETDPIITFLVSSGAFGDETWFVELLRKTLDDSNDPLLRRIQIIIRPHHIIRKRNARVNKKLKMQGYVLIPETGTLPNTSESLKLFYDTLYHSDIVVGIGTSGFIDSIIVGKPVVTMFTEYYRQIQEEAPHLKSLFKSGAIGIARKPAEFVEIIKKLLDGHDEYKEKRKSFMKQYVRPQGLNISASEIVVQELENLVKNRQ